jgi:hypothetical protein
MWQRALHCVSNCRTKVFLVLLIDPDDAEIRWRAYPASTTCNGPVSKQISLCCLVAVASKMNEKKKRAGEGKREGLAHIITCSRGKAAGGGDNAGNVAGPQVNDLPLNAPGVSLKLISVAQKLHHHGH